MNVFPDLEIDNTVVIVSGLPRSGTSMLMRILSLGGISPLSDGVRVNNSHNPHGYFEYEAIKNKSSYVDWMDSASGKSLKVISRFIPSLPATKNYQILFLHRNIAAVLRSQREMALTFSDSIWNDEDALKLSDVYSCHIENTLRWIEERPNMYLHQVHYEKILNSPIEAISDICNFLAPRKLDLDKMILGVDTTLDHSGQLRGING